MTTYPSTAPKTIDVFKYLLLLKRLPTLVASFTVSYLGVLGLLSFVVAGFLLHVVVGFVVLGVCLLILDKAVKREASHS